VEVVWRYTTSKRATAIPDSPFAHEARFRGVTATLAATRSGVATMDG
jgi:hypothetical protein